MCSLFLRRMTIRTSENIAIRTDWGTDHCWVTLKIRLLLSLHGFWENWTKKECIALSPSILCTHLFYRISIGPAPRSISLFLLFQKSEVVFKQMGGEGECSFNRTTEVFYHRHIDRRDLTQGNNSVVNFLSITVRSNYPYGEPIAPG